MNPEQSSQKDSGLEIVCDHWPLLPTHLRQLIVETVKPYGRKQTGFPTPMGARWEDVEILLTDRDRVEIKVGTIRQRFTIQTLGLEDKRRKGYARVEWRTLKKYAENPQRDAYYRLPKSKHLKVEISQFRRWLIEFFGIPGDPLLPFKTGQWLPRFTIGVDYTA